MNKLTLLGNLTKNPELFYTTKGTAVANTSIAVNDRRNPDKVMFIDVVAFQGLAEIFNQYLRKGSKVLVHGSIDFEQYIDKQGNKRQKHKMIVNEMEMLDGKTQQTQQINQKQNFQPLKHDADTYFEKFPDSYDGITEDELPF